MKTIAFLLSLFTASLLPAFAADALTRHEVTVDGTVREALIAIPPNAKTSPSPLVFAFHGHGGNMANAARMYHIHTLWPEAIVVYPQGLNTPGYFFRTAAASAPIARRSRNCARLCSVTTVR